MAVDAQNRYLATGDVDGTVKVWDIREYCLHQQDEVVTVPPSKLFYSPYPYICRFIYICMTTLCPIVIMTVLLMQVRTIKDIIQL